jgi:hypothetical protein
VYFAHIASAIDIPPDSRFDESEELTKQIWADARFEVILSGPDGPIAHQLEDALAKEFGVPLDMVTVLVQSELRRREGTPSPPTDPADILVGEWHAFQTPHAETDDRDRFITNHVDVGAFSGDPRAWLLEPLDRIVQATRLREVRALTGFSRLSPSGPHVAPDLGTGLDWLPALEVHGEGIFLSLKEEEVTRWESGPVAARASVLEARKRRSLRRDWLPEVTPRFVMLHSLAHLLIRQLAFESGYASASLTERIYARTPDGGAPGMAGVLIYTAAGDQEGTLGGLVRQGEPERLLSTLVSTLNRASWCSLDPICRESSGQGIDSMNLAACHACTLIAETSCGHSNALLDRAMVVGQGQTAGVAFFDHAFASVLERMVAETSHETA